LRRLGDEIRIARSTAGLSVRELARQSGFSRSYLSRIEQGQASGVSLRFLDVILTLLGMELSARPFPQGPPLRNAQRLRGDLSGLVR
jgi:transcriptional regulator with XRE-family HTH domain